MTAIGKKPKKERKESKSLLSFDGCVTQMGVVEVAFCSKRSNNAINNSFIRDFDIKQL
jgi:hypothetical protein